MPFSVYSAGGPGSVKWLSNSLRVGVKLYSNSPFSLSVGSQSIPLEETARFTKSSPQYIKYFPFTFLAINLPSTNSVTMEPDLLHTSKNLPSWASSKTGPCFVQLRKSLEVALDKRATSVFHAV